MILTDAGVSVGKFAVNICDSNHDSEDEDSSRVAELLMVKYRELAHVYAVSHDCHARTVKKEICEKHRKLNFKARFKYWL